MAWFVVISMGLFVSYCVIGWATVGEEQIPDEMEIAQEMIDEAKEMVGAGLQMIGALVGFLYDGINEFIDD